MLLGFARGQRTPTFVREVDGTPPPSLDALTSPRSPQSVPVPTPSPWCPQGTSSTNYCLFVPPGAEINEVQWCTNCSASEVPTLNVYLDSSHTPPPNFQVQAFSSGDPNPVDCSVAQPGGASSCTVTTCYLPYPSCYVESQWISNVGTPPANVVGEAQISEPGYQCCPGVLNNWFSVPPAIVDDDISLGLQIVSSPNPSPAPIMVGTEVKLEASPAADLTSVQWNFDSAATTDIVGSYALAGSPTAPPAGRPTSVAAPSPVPTGGANPVVFYWVSGDSITWQSGVPAAKHVNIISYAANVQGPLSTDVYYPVAAPVASLSTRWANVQLPSDYSNDPSTCPGPYTDISLGDTCTQNDTGFNWDYGLGVPSYGGGWLTMAQLIYTTDSRTYVNCVQSCTRTEGGPPYGLDATFPYDAAVPTSLHWKSNDSPGFEVANTHLTQCSSASYSGHFEDYFLYQPSVPSYRHGTPIWVPMLTDTWSFSGSANAPFLSLSSSTNPSPVANLPSFPTWTSLSPNLISDCPVSP